jgi:pyruvate carboxylase
VPNILLQMLLRGANAVGYTNYPDNVVRHFVAQAAQGGIDVFRVFDCFNWVENMRVSIDAVLETGKIAEGAICYTGDILEPERAKYSLGYYVGVAKQLEAAGCHMLAIKDMAGLLKPEAARVLIRALREETALPIHLHTHDTSGISGATVLAAVEAGVNIVDAAMDSMSGSTSQPCLGSLVAAMKHTPRDTTLDLGVVQDISRYWESARKGYLAFENDLGAGTSEVYLHEMPGGQITNLREQARASGLEARWKDVIQAYRTANDVLGDIPKVTPSSKVVGDMAIMMVSQGLSAADLTAPGRELAFPTSVVEMMRGDLGQPPGGFPAAFQAKVLKGGAAISVPPGSLLAPADIDAAGVEVRKLVDREPRETDVASYMMYPKVFAEFARANATYGPVSVLPTRVFFYGMTPGEEIAADLAPGKTLVVRMLTIGETNDDGEVKVFFELNGQPRIVRVPDRRSGAPVAAKRKAEEGNARHVGAPMPGMVATLFVKTGQAVKAGDVLLTLEAMKMETPLSAAVDAVVGEVLVARGSYVDVKDLLLTFE